LSGNFAFIVAPTHSIPNPKPCAWGAL
jgi:hypothetical protein